ncbi:protein kinase domain-containing protein [Halobacteriales archaeon Cl-PHB]
MSRDARDRDAADPESWVRGLRDVGADGRSRSPLADVGRLRDLTARRTAGLDTDDAGAETAEPDAAERDISTDTTTTRSPGRRHSRPPRTTPDSSSPLVAAIERVADVDDLSLVGSPADHRYGRVVGARVAAGGSTYDLALRLFRRPDDESAFADALVDQLDRWAAVGDIDGVVPLPDGAKQPRPWALAPVVGDRLADRGDRSLERALREARSLATSVAVLHDRGVVHAGIDPGNVVYVPDGEVPQLDNVGLLDVYRRYADPATALDPRYAAPEYFDDRYGVVDHATDVYQLGAVLYRLLTGQAPYDGSPESVREGVLTEAFPRPSAVDPAIPAALDDVVERATTVDAFDRYETAAALRDDLDAVCVQLLDD